MYRKSYKETAEGRELDIGEKVIILVKELYGYQGTVIDTYKEDASFRGYYVITYSPFDKHHVYLKPDELIPLSNP